MRRVNSQTQHGLPHIHPKMGSTVESRRRVRAAGLEALRRAPSQARNPKSDRLCVMPDTYLQPPADYAQSSPCIII